MTSVTIDFCGEIYRITPQTPFTIGREANLVLDEDNPFLHRIFLKIEWEHNLWWLKNVGSTLTATVSAGEGQMQAWLPPAGQIPLVFSSFAVWFTAGEVTYELELSLEEAVYDTVRVEQVTDGDLTIGTVSLTPRQKLMILALAEDVLRRGNRGSGTVPTSAQAAERLGWPVSAFNRQLDAVCAKLENMGVRGLHGGPGRHASSRKARLVEYALGTRILTGEDLVLLDGAGIID